MDETPEGDALQTRELEVKRVQGIAAAGRLLRRLGELLSGIGDACRGKCGALRAGAQHFSPVVRVRRHRALRYRRAVAGPGDDLAFARLDRPGTQRSRLRRSGRVRPLFPIDRTRQRPAGNQGPGALLVSPLAADVRPVCFRRNLRPAARGTHAAAGDTGPGQLLRGLGPGRIRDNAECHRGPGTTGLGTARPDRPGAVGSAGRH